MIENKDAMIIHTPTLDDYTKVVKWAFSQNILWRNGDKVVNEDQWEYHESDTCIIINCGKLTYCGMKSALDEFDETELEMLDMIQFRKVISAKYRSNKFGRKYDLK